MFIVVRGDLSPNYQLPQCLHALTEFIYDFPDLSKRWKEKSNFIVVLSAKDEFELSRLSDKLKSKDINFSEFREPDIGDQLTSICVEPGVQSYKMLSHLPLALKNLSLDGINKNNQN